MRILLAATTLCFLAVPALAADAITFERASTLETTQPAPVAGVAVIITNTGPDDKIIAARSSASLSVNLETTAVDKDGRIMAQKTKEIVIPGNGKSTTLNSAGDYVALIGVMGTMKAGTKFPLSLTFEKAGEKTLDVEAVTPDEYMKRYTPEMLGDNLEKARTVRENAPPAPGEDWATRLRKKIHNLGRSQQGLPTDNPAVVTAPIITETAPQTPITTGPMSTPDSALPPEISTDTSAQPPAQTQTLQITVKQGPDGPIVTMPKAPPIPVIDAKHPYPNDDKVKADMEKQSGAVLPDGPVNTPAANPEATPAPAPSTPPASAPAPQK